MDPYGAGQIVTSQNGVKRGATSSDDGRMRMGSIRRVGAGLALAVLCAVAIAGCSTTEHHAGLTERQRDSVIAKSVLPGAQVVGRALAVTDQAAARAAGMDSLDH